MPRVGFSKQALLSLDRLIESRSLPPNTRSRVAAAVRHLSDFPRAGSPLPALDGLQGLRVVVGPWDWMLVIYEWIEEDDLAAIIVIEDSRAFEGIAAAAKSQRTD